MRRIRVSSSAVSARRAISSASGHLRVRGVARMRDDARLPRPTSRSPSSAKPPRRRSISPRPRRCSISGRRFRRATSTIRPIPKTPGSRFRCRTAAARPSFAFSPRPTGREAALAISPTRTRPTLIEAASSNPDIVLERSPGFGEHTFRLVIPPNNAGTLALHFQGVRETPSLLAWTEAALVSHNRAIRRSDRPRFRLADRGDGFCRRHRHSHPGGPSPRWAALFLAAVVVGELSRTGFFDTSWLTALAGPYALSAFALVGRDSRAGSGSSIMSHRSQPFSPLARAPARLGSRSRFS